MKSFQIFIFSLAFCGFTVSALAQNLTAEQIVNNYAQSIGGKDAVEQISSRISKGILVDEEGFESNIEIFQKFPDKSILILNNKYPGEFKQVADGVSGFTLDPKNGSKEMPDVFLTHWKRNNNLRLPIQLNAFFPKIEIKSRGK